MGHRTARVFGASTLAAAALVGVSTTAAFAEPPKSIPANATDGDAKWAPAIDYDTDSCYSSPAVDADGNAAEGLGIGGGVTENCRDESDLDNTNTYVRTKCVADGWCAHMYAYYFEKDQTMGGSVAAGSHSGDAEGVIVWVHNDQAVGVSVSAHGEYQQHKAAKDVRWDGDTHPKVVYHKDGGSTHSMRFANDHDDPPENHRHTWQYPAPLSWDKMSDPVRNTLNTHDYGAPKFDISDARYTDVLNKVETPAGVPTDVW